MVWIPPVYSERAGYGGRRRNTRHSVKRICINCIRAGKYRIRYRAFNLTYLSKGVTKVAVKDKVRIKVKGYDHSVVDAAAAKIVETAKRTGSRVAGPIPLPTDKQIITILRAVHKYKDSREQFEQRTHKRLIDVIRPTNKTVDALQNLELPAGVEISMEF